ncbi:MAG: hypothetical protein A4E30_00305 [Methanomassiliicoccales archaeon PtaB.Bin215]|nr:MAG: hypothetical protein A4E30_00305 [Methanomassiliicoccales archaeon PtaB.Bin215]
MMLSVTNGKLHLDLSLEERIILHLDSAPPLPEHEYDVRGLPRTVLHMWPTLAPEVSQAKFYRTIEKIRDDDKDIQIIGRIHTHEKPKNRSDVYALTLKGQVLAKAILQRAIV